MPRLDLVLPCYNPAAGWAEGIIKNIFLLQELLPETAIAVYLVNDGSIKGIKHEDIQLLKTTLPQFTYLPYAQNRGKGFALRYGIQACRHEYCIYTDVDFPYYPESLAAVYAALQQGADVAAGTRDSHYYKSVPGTRTGISKLLKLFNRWCLGLPLSDTQCGLKGFNTTGRALFLRTLLDRYLFDLEFIFMAAKQEDLRLRPVPVRLRPGIQFRPMNPGILISELRSLLRHLF